MPAASDLPPAGDCQMKLFGIRSRRGAGLTVIDEALVIRGDLETDGSVRVDGRAEGRSHRMATLIVGPRGAVTGDVDADTVTVAGTILGNVSARVRVELEPGSSVRGDVCTGALVMREGASVSGVFSVGPDAHDAAARLPRPYELGSVALQPDDAAA
jgi:cytoskeletal protein CcmA (bactofilin family)